MNLSFLKGNWVDLLIIVILLYYLSEAWRVGFWVILTDFFSFFFSLLIALRGYQLVSVILRNNFSLSHSLSNAIGFLVTAALAEILLGFLFGVLVRKIPYKIWKSRWSKLIATIPAFGEGLVLAAFILSLVISFPLSPRIKADITDSKIGGVIVQKTSGIESRINEIFGGVIEDSLTYLTVKPESKDSILISVDRKELEVDEETEKAMFAMVNEERNRQERKELVWEKDLVFVARIHAQDMWEREYFGHLSPEGNDVGDRLRGEGVSYVLAGENLALAPTVKTAHLGLMSSEGHRENILNIAFRKVGIGVVDNGVYGKMFVQVFTD